MDALSNRQIARFLGIPQNTIKTYLWRLFKKLQVHNRAGLANWGRAYDEAKRIQAVHFNELHPDLEAPMEDPGWEHATSDFEIFRAMAQTLELTKEQARIIAELMEDRASA